MAKREFPSGQLPLTVTWPDMWDWFLRLPPAAARIKRGLPWKKTPILSLSPSLENVVEPTQAGEPLLAAVGLGALLAW